jgi:hypothetical protein
MSNRLAVEQDTSLPAEGGPLLRIDRELFRERFDKGPFLIEHNLCDHPLFTIDRMLKLAKTLPENKVEYHAGEVPIGLDPKHTPRNGLSAEETIRRIEDCKSWLLFRNPELDPEYRELLESCMAEVKPLSEPICPGMRELESFLILSSPGTVTPIHIDPEHNFLLQIRGEKHVTVYNRDLLEQQQLEKLFCGAHRNIPYDDKYKNSGETFHLPPGKGVHIPFVAPHYVVNGNGVSVSISITFRTPDVGRGMATHVMNSWLRRLGINPAEVGVSAPRDQLKSLTLRAWRKSLRLTGLGRSS